MRLPQRWWAAGPAPRADLDPGDGGAFEEGFETRYLCYRRHSLEVEGGRLPPIEDVFRYRGGRRIEVAGDDPSTPVELKVLAFRDSEVRTLNRTITTAEDFAIRVRSTLAGDAATLGIGAA